MCSPGYSVFPHHCGYISIAIIIQTYLQHCEIKLIDNNNLNKVKWSRDYYLKEDEGKYCWLTNPQWKVRPTIYFIYGTMKVLTCKYKNGRECTHNG